MAPPIKNGYLGVVSPLYNKVKLLGGFNPSEKYWSNCKYKKYLKPPPTGVLWATARGIFIWDQLLQLLTWNGCLVTLTTKVVQTHVAVWCVQNLCKGLHLVIVLYEITWLDGWTNPSEKISIVKNGLGSSSPNNRGEHQKISSTTTQIKVRKGFSKT